MKKSVITIALIMLSFVSFAQKSKEQNVPQIIKNALSEKFPNAKNVKRDKEENNFEAIFKNNMHNSILFNAYGKIIETEIAIDVNQLPKNALQFLNDNFKNKKIKETAKIVNEKGTTFYEAEIKVNNLFFHENGNFITKVKVS